MEIFDWRKASSEAGKRYDGASTDVIGLELWKNLVQELTRGPEGGREPGGAEFRHDFEAFGAFLQHARQQYVIRQKPHRVFVSHQRQDVPYAERIAWLADSKGFDYWLDVHDPVLALANWMGPALPAPVQSILIASIIEMALLNCSHVITVQTTHAAASQWVPYEFGRAKEAMPTSTQAASWFDDCVYAANTADYLKLGVCAMSDADVGRWLGSEAGKAFLTARTPSWSPKLKKLPN